MLRNNKVAVRFELPLSQDTGSAIVFAKRVVSADFTESIAGEVEAAR